MAFCNERKLSAAQVKKATLGPSFEKPFRQAQRRCKADFQETGKQEVCPSQD